MKSQTLGKSSEIECLASLKESDQNRILNSLSRTEAEALLFDWRSWARPDQMPPETKWHIWLIMTGRGWGKTRTGAEWVRDQAKAPKTRIALVGRTPADARDVMIEGESGILNISPPSFMPLYEPSKRRLTWPNGSMATVYSSESPASLRGPQHHKAWGDELATWKTSEGYENLMLGLRLGLNPQALFTTTPKPIHTIRDIIKDSKELDSGIQVTFGKTYDNIGNLAPSFISTIIRKYKGTTIGQQELDGVLLENLPGALWDFDLIDIAKNHVYHGLESRVVIGVDPAVTSHSKSDEWGIIIASKREDQKSYVKFDLSGVYSPDKATNIVIQAYHDSNADAIVVETNQGGDMIETIFRQKGFLGKIIGVPSIKGKSLRAEPIQALYEQGLVAHNEDLENLENEMMTWVPDETVRSPNRIDAMVFAITELYGTAIWRPKYVPSVGRKRIGSSMGGFLNS